MADDVIIFCDESGNSGPNYLDPEQPFYVLGGWVVPFDQLVDISAAIEKLRQGAFPKSRELKSSTLFRSKRGKKFAADLFSYLGRRGCVPLFVLAEKRYCIAAKIVETFLDPAFNDVVKGPFVIDTITKQEMADKLYTNVPANVLNAFAENYRNPTPDGFLRSLDEIVHAVRHLISEELAGCLEGSRSHAKELAEAESTVKTLPKGWDTINFPMLISYFMVIERIGREGLISPRKLIHDEQHAYEASFKAAFQIHRSAAEGSMLLPHGTTIYSRIEHIPEFEMVRSFDQPLLWAADILAGAVSMLCDLAMRGGPAADADMELARLTLPALLAPRPRLTESIASRECYRSLGQIFFRPLAGPVEELPAPAQEASEIENTHAEMFPHPDSSLEDHGQRWSVDFPLYALVAKETGALLILTELDVNDRGVPAGGTLTLLFTSAEKAEVFLGLLSSEYGLEQEQEVRRFGESRNDVEEFIGLLEAALEFTSTIAVDPGPEQKPIYVSLERFLNGLKRIIERTLRILYGGLDSQLLQWHDIRGQRVMTLLASDGRYVAAILPHGRVYSGKTRQAALDAWIGGDGSGNT